MTVHIGELTSEVVAAGGATPGRTEEVSAWEETRRIQAAMDRIHRDRCRTGDERDGSHD